eukprot:12992868-Alexandrium_andersonii.AAC.1
MEVQIAEVKEPLASAPRICEAGTRAVFEDHGSYIKRKAPGRRTRLGQDDHGYAATVRLASGTGQDFPRQGSRRRQVP